MRTYCSIDDATEPRHRPKTEFQKDAIFHLRRTQRAVTAAIAAVEVGHWDTVAKAVNVASYGLFDTEKVIDERLEG